jgi:hypothetical protein
MYFYYFALSKEIYSVKNKNYRLTNGSKCYIMVIRSIFIPRGR